MARMVTELKMPRLPHTISIMGPELPLWFHPSGTNGEVASRLPCTLDL
jgi:hypothetical protein